MVFHDRFVCQVGHRAFSIKVDAIDPFRHFFRPSLPNVTADIRLSAHSSKVFRNSFVPNQLLQSRHPSWCSPFCTFARPHHHPVIFISKQPPGQRRLGIFDAFSMQQLTSYSATPFVFGIGEFHTHPNSSGKYRAQAPSANCPEVRRLCIAPMALITAVAFCRW